MRLHTQEGKPCYKVYKKACRISSTCIWKFHGQHYEINTTALKSNKEEILLQEHTTGISYKQKVNKKEIASSHKNTFVSWIYNWDTLKSLPGGIHPQVGEVLNFSELVRNKEINKSHINSTPPQRQPYMWCHVRRHYASLASLTHFCKRREGSGELHIHAVSWRTVQCGAITLQYFVTWCSTSLFE